MSSLDFVGIDISQARLDIAIRPGASFSITHDESAIAALVEQLRTLSPTLIVLEATGGMELPLTSALATAGLPVVFVNPVRCATSPRPVGTWPRSMHSMPRCSRNSPRSCASTRARFRMRRPEPWPCC